MFCRAKFPTTDATDFFSAFWFLFHLRKSHLFVGGDQRTSHRGG